MFIVGIVIKKNTLKWSMVKCEEKRILLQASRLFAKQIIENIGKYRVYTVSKLYELENRLRISTGYAY